MPRLTEHGEFNVGTTQGRYRIQQLSQALIPPVR